MNGSNKHSLTLYMCYLMADQAVCTCFIWILNILYFYAGLKRNIYDHLVVWFVALSYVTLRKKTAPQKKKKKKEKKTDGRWSTYGSVGPAAPSCDSGRNGWKTPVPCTMTRQRPSLFSLPPRRSLVLLRLLTTNRFCLILILPLDDDGQRGDQASKQHSVDWLLTPPTQITPAGHHPPSFSLSLLSLSSFPHLLASRCRSVA